MSENLNPDTIEIKEEATPAEAPVQSEVVDYSGKSLAELSDLFHQFATSQDRLSRAKEAEAIKSAFYKTLLREKEKVQDGATEVFDKVEENFKVLYAAFKKEKAEFNKQLDAQKEANLKEKLKVLEDLKALLEKDEDVTATMPEFREIQKRWRETGAVPAQSFRDLNNNYQLYVEQFYDRLNINRALRDLDFKKNLEAKTAMCEKAEELAKSENCVEAFNELQKLHDAWKDLGPVAKQYREEIWERFKTATAAVNKLYQAHFEELKGEFAANLATKEALCEKVEAIAGQEITDSKLWNTLSKEIEALQAEWRTAGQTARKDSQKVYDRFRAACDKFFERKREFYGQFKNEMEENLRKKTEICEMAEQLKQSTEWKKATDQFIELQKKWKEIGAVPRKKSDAIWKRFRAACDEFFKLKEENATPSENDYYANLKAKQRIIDNINAYQTAGDAASDKTAMEEFAAAFSALGFVPFKEKERIAKAYKEAMAKAFPAISAVRQQAHRGVAKVLSEKEKLVARYKTLEQEIATKENNILFFAGNKGNALVQQMQAGIDAAKLELQEMEQKIRKIEEEEKTEGNE